MGTKPRVSIGMPAYNAAATIGASLESLLGQTFGDFELIVSDNASTDATRDVVETFVRADRRVRYVRQPENIGAPGNYSHLVRIAGGECFKWAAASDLCAPTFLDRCLRALEADQLAVLAAPRTLTFAGEVGTAKPYAHDIEIVDASPSARLRHLLTSLRLNNLLNGVIRMSALRRTPLIAGYYGADIVLVGHLALLGRLRLVGEPLFYRRMEVAAATALQDPVACRMHHYPHLSARILFQNWRRQGAWLRAGLTTPMSPAERMRVLGLIARVGMWNRRGLWSDVAQAVSYAARRRDGF